MTLPGVGWVPLAVALGLLTAAALLAGFVFGSTAAALRDLAAWLRPR